MDCDSAAATRPAENSTTPVRSAGAGPRVSVQLPARAIVTTAVAIGAPNANP